MDSNIKPYEDSEHVKRLLQTDEKDLPNEDRHLARLLKNERESMSKMIESYTKASSKNSSKK